MDDETYKALLERLDKQDAKIAELEKTNTDLRSFNRALLGRTVDTSKPNDKEADLAKLEEQLNKGLSHGITSK